MGAAGRWPQVVVVGTDGSSTAAQAVARAVDLVAASGGTLHLVRAFRGDDVEAGAIDAFLFDVADEARASGVAEVVVHRLLGSAAEVLASVAETAKADLVVVGNKGMGKRVRLGVVPDWLSHHLSCSLLLVDTQ